MWGRAAAVAVGMLYGGVALARSAEGAPEKAGDVADVESLKALLAKRDEELKAAKAQLEAFDDARWYHAAEELGVARAVQPDGFTGKQRMRLAAAIVREADHNGLDPFLVVAVIRSESSFNSYAVSGVGAMGLMQIMPDTGTFFARQRGTQLGRKQNLFDAEVNVELGSAYLAELIQRFGTVENALVAYNAGPSAARKILANAQTRKRFLAGYPRKVVNELKRLRAENAEELTARESFKVAQAVLVHNRMATSR